MTATIAQKITTDPQSVMLLNLNMFMQLKGLYRKDLAEYMGRKPQAVSRMFISGSAWSINDTCKAADFFGVPLSTLLDPSLTPSKALDIIGERHDDEGGLPVADSISDGRLRRGWMLAA